MFVFSLVEQEVVKVHFLKTLYAILELKSGNVESGSFDLGKIKSSNEIPSLFLQTENRNHFSRFSTFQTIDCS